MPDTGQRLKKRRDPGIGTGVWLARSPFMVSVPRLPSLGGHLLDSPEQRQELCRLYIDSGVLVQLGTCDDRWTPDIYGNPLLVFSERTDNECDMSIHFMTFIQQVLHPIDNLFFGRRNPEQKTARNISDLGTITRPPYCAKDLIVGGWRLRLDNDFVCRPQPFIQDRLGLFLVWRWNELTGNFRLRSSSDHIGVLAGTQHQARCETRGEQFGLGMSFHWLTSEVCHAGNPTAIEKAT